MMMMKTLLLAFCLLGASVAFGQTGGALSNEPQMVEFHSHEQQASQHDLGRMQNVMETSGSYHAQGSRPLWEVAPPLHEVSLGEVARALREDHVNVKKSTVVWTNY